METQKLKSDNEIYLLTKYIKSVLWRVAKCLSYIEEARCLKVNYVILGACLRMVLLTDVYRNLTSLWIKPRERAFKEFKSPVLNVLIFLRCKISPSHIIVHKNTKIMSRMVFAPATGLQPFKSRTPKPTVTIVYSCIWVSLFWVSLLLVKKV